MVPGNGKADQFGFEMEHLKTKTKIRVMHRSCSPVGLVLFLVGEFCLLQALTCVTDGHKAVL